MQYILTKDRTGYTFGRFHKLVLVALFLNNHTKVERRKTFKHEKNINLYALNVMHLCT
jgi:hypothetical protein